MELSLFKKFTEEDLQILLHDPNVKISSYDKDNVIFMEEDTCENLSIILEGNIEIQKIDQSGKLLTVASLKKGDAFGENLLFGDKNLYPMTVMSKTKSIILHIPKNIVALLCQKNLDFLYEFLKTLSNKAVALSSKIKQVTLKTIREKICEFLYKKYCYSNNKKIMLNMSKKEWADKLGVQRPSLSRELMKLKEEGIIDYEKDYILILDVELLENDVQ
ncbi:Crp/Fnr family transcriptional regulator [Clostridium sp. MSJ-4]|uniref:Crp/Fnr family transcriptional regulator n=2 Tax=Clostridiaceae TaxID=31979 RepID=A0ABS6F2Q0_9CLOT|nr:Crp/Fnr family transcriptional regulator [Clostridium simiarum]